MTNEEFQLALSLAHVERISGTDAIPPAIAIGDITDRTALLPELKRGTIRAFCITANFTFSTVQSGRSYSSGDELAEEIRIGSELFELDPSTQGLAISRDFWRSGRFEDSDSWISEGEQISEGVRSATYTKVAWLGAKIELLRLVQPSARDRRQHPPWQAVHAELFGIQIASGELYAVLPELSPAATSDTGGSAAPEGVLTATEVRDWISNCPTENYKKAYKMLRDDFGKRAPNRDDVFLPEWRSVKRHRGRGRIKKSPN